MLIKYINRTFKLLLLVTLCSINGVQASNNNIINNSNSQINIQEHFNLRNIMQSADFSWNDKNTEIIATFSDNPNNRGNDTTFNTNHRTNITEHKDNEIKGYSDDQNEKPHVSFTNDKYAIAFFLAGRQEHVSLINYKLNNREEQLTDTEKEIKKSLENIKYKRFGDSKRLQWVVPIQNDEYDKLLFLKNYDANINNIPNKFYSDINEILQRNRVNNEQDQLKLDIYKQMEEQKQNNSYKYDEAFSLAYKYLINQFYTEDNINNLRNNVRNNLHNVNNTINTPFKLRDLIQKATFSFKDNHIIATFHKNPHKIDKYDEAALIIRDQENLSVLNYKLNNHMTLHNTDREVFSKVNYIKNNLENNEEKQNEIKTSSLIYSSYNHDLLKKYSSDTLNIPNAFYNDIKRIIRERRVQNINDQLKLDIYRQMEDDTNNNGVNAYDDAFKIAYNYFMDKFYH